MNSTERLTCCLCHREFSIYDHIDTLEKIKKRYGEYAETTVCNVCPDCLKKKPKVRKISEQRVQIAARDSYKGLIYIFWTLFLISILAQFYSLISKKLNLPNFRFSWYVSAHLAIVLFSFRFPYIRSTAKYLLRPPWIELILILFVSFFIPSFRNIFYSYFPNRNLKFVITVLFVIALYLELNIIRFVVDLALLKRYSKLRSMNLGFLIYPILILLIFLSPFYLGSIKINPSSYINVIKPESVDKIYEEEITAGSVDKMIALKYFYEGKYSSSLGTRKGFVESLEYYRKALELIPNFSTAYSEMAFSYANLAKISDEAKYGKAEVDGYMNKAEEMLKLAEAINQRNPTLIAVDLVIQFAKSEIYLSNRIKFRLTDVEINYYQSNLNYARAEGLKKLAAIADQLGFTDKVFLAEAVLTEDNIKRGSLLATILRKIAPDDAQIHNLLGITYFLINDTESAKKMFERAIRLSHDFGKAHINLALVYPKKQTKILFKEAVSKDKDVKNLAQYYSILFSIMNSLRWLYILLGIAWFSGNAILSVRFIPKTQNGFIDLEAFEKNREQIQIWIEKKTRKFSTWISIIFMTTYGLFELYIHLIKPVNSIEYMFPIRFPFF
jgi:tetratricopeptide (TPR) repeat protein